MGCSKLSLVDEIRSYKGVIFDMDGTLMNSEIWHHVAWRKAGNMHGMTDIPTDVLVSFGGLPSAEIVRRLNKMYGTQADIEQVSKDKAEIYINECMPQAEPFTKICALLKELHAAGTRIAIATSSHQKEARFLLGKNNLLPFIDALITGDMVTRGKPNPDIFLLAAEHLKLEPTECLVFEDTIVGMACAKNANMDLVRVFDGEFLVDHIVHPTDHDVTAP